MSISPLSGTTNGSHTPYWTWAANYGWIHFEDYYFKYGSKTHVSHLAGGTPWRYPTEYGLDIYNIKNKDDSIRIRTQYPDGTIWEGCLAGGTSDVFYAMDAEGWSPGNVNSPNFDQNLVNGAITKALDKLSSQKADMGTNIAEGHQAIRMVCEPSMAVWKAIKAFKHGNFAQVMRELGLTKRNLLLGRFAADNWLAYQFGWKPLLNDIYDSFQKFHEVVTNKDLIVSGNGTMSTTKNGVKIMGASANPWVVKAKSKCRVDAYIRVPELRQANQWNLVNPLEVAWETMPWSFAIDWFVPVGNTLEALTASAGLEFLSGSITSYRETISNWYFTGSGIYTILQPGNIEIEKLQMRRYPIYTFPFPQFYAKTTNPFSSTHTANALALWRQIPPLR